MFFTYSNEPVLVLNNIEKNYSKILISSGEINEFCIYEFVGRLKLIFNSSRSVGALKISPHFVLGVGLRGKLE